MKNSFSRNFLYPFVTSALSALVMIESVLSAPPTPQIVLSWPVSADSFAVETTTRLDGPWSRVFGHVTEIAGRNRLAIDIDAIDRFFRLPVTYGTATRLDGLMSQDPDVYERGPSLSKGMRLAKVW
jgi:hypothetical protein